MSEDKKSLIDLVPDSIDNAVKNVTDKPTQNIGTTLADIWYLVFGGISKIFSIIFVDSYCQQQNTSLFPQHPH